MSRPPLEVADLIRTVGAAFVERNRQWLSWKHIKVLLAIARCRTAALGGHLDECTRCGHRATISYNSCRDRHCPKCQTAARERWIAARQRELLPTRYVHVVFTLPPSCFPRQVCCCSPAGLSRRPTQLPRKPDLSRPAQDLRRLATAAVQKGLGGVLETTLRWPGVCAPVFGPLHPSRSHL